MLLLASALTAVSLSACQLLFGGPFPGLLVQTTAQQDLSVLVSGSSASSFNLSVLRLGNTEYVLLYSSAGFDSSQAHLVVLSPRLKVLNAYTMNDIVALAPAGVPLSGDGAVAHLVDGRIIVGNMQMQPSGAGLVPLDKLWIPSYPVDVQLQGSTIVGPPSVGTDTWTDFHSDPGDTLSWAMYEPDWSNRSDFSAPIGRSAQFRGIFADPENPAHNVAFLAFSDGSNTYYLQVPKAPDLVGAFPGGLFANSSYPRFTKKGLDSSDIFITKDSIIQWDGGSNAWVRFTRFAPVGETSAG